MGCLSMYFVTLEGELIFSRTFSWESWVTWAKNNSFQKSFMSGYVIVPGLSLTEDHSFFNFLASGFPDLKSTINLLREDSQAKTDILPHYLPVLVSRMFYRWPPFHWECKPECVPTLWTWGEVHLITTHCLFKVLLQML